MNCPTLSVMESRVFINRNCSTITKLILKTVGAKNVLKIMLENIVLF